MPFGSLIFSHSSKITKLPRAAPVATPRDRVQFARSIQPSKKPKRRNVVKTKPSLSRKKAYRNRDKRTRVILIQFLSLVSWTISSLPRRDSAKAASDKITRIGPNQKKMKPGPGSEKLPTPSWVAA